MKLRDILEKIERWTYEPGKHWRTWAAHSALTVAWMLPFGILAWLGVELREPAMWMVAGWWLIRELLEVFWYAKEAPLYDHLLDVAAPWLVALAIAIA